MIVVIYEPKGAFYGASVAGPVFKSVAETAININHEYGRKINEMADGSNKIMPGKHKGFNQDFKHIFDYVGLNYKEKTKSDWVNVDPFENRMLIEDDNISDNQIPDVRGMGARDAVFVLENLGLKVKMDGIGKVVTQNIRPGTPARGQKIDIRLN
jgi:cell division protein FtsI (penicillin-binding protein 3)